MGKDLRGLILGTQDISQEKVSITEWDVDVFVKGLTGAERDSYEQSLFIVSEHGKKVDVNMNRTNLRAKLLVITICDEDGNRIFTDADVEALGAKSASALDKLFEIAQRLSGLSDKDVEELEKTRTARHKVFCI